MLGRVMCVVCDFPPALGRRRLHPVGGRGEEQQPGRALAAGHQELSQRGTVDGRLESPSGLPAVQELPELVQGAAAQSG